MNRVSKILITVGVITILVVVISVGVSIFVKPNQQTPVSNLLPTPKSEIKFPTNFTVAAWVWNSPTELKDVDDLLASASTAGINTLYIYIDEYLDIFEMPESGEKTEKLNRYISGVETVLARAKQNNIAVHALSGDSSYSYDSHEYIPPILLKHVFEYNQTHPEAPFEGLQFDIEFYDDERFPGSTEEYTQAYLNLVDRLTEQTISLNKEFGQNLKLGFVIPFWFDKPNDYFAKPILPQIVTSMSKLPGSYLVIMAYRNIVEGDGSVMDVAIDELKLMSDSPVKTIIAQELVENKDKKITHFGKSREDIRADLFKIIEISQTYPAFEGISIHDLDAYLNTR